MLSDVTICHRCPHFEMKRQGLAVCDLDGSDIVEHAQSGYCPERFFSDVCARCGKKHHISVCPEPPPPPCTADASKPGGLIRAISQELQIEDLEGCGCETMCRQMNGWGWQGCLRNAPTLIQWFRRQAKERELSLSAGKIAGAVMRVVMAAVKREIVGLAEMPIDGVSNGGSTAVRG